MSLGNDNTTGKGSPSEKPEASKATLDGGEAPPPEADPSPPEDRQNQDGDAPESATPGLNRREFLRRAGMGAGAMAVGPSLAGTLSACERLPSLGTSARVVVVGAGTFGGWTAYRLQQMGAQVTLVDLYGPGNSRSSSGDETRGIRATYRDRELWVDWANQAIRRWEEIDAEWEERFGRRVYFTTGDLIFRPEREATIDENQETFERKGIPYEILDMAEVEYRWPQIRPEGMDIAFYEPNAGVAKSRLICEFVAEAFRQEGGEIRIGRATPGQSGNGRLRDVQIEPGDPLSADTFVFALGPWLPTAFPDVIGDRMAIPMGHVYYFGTPPGDDRYAHPNLPSYGFPGITGWPSLPPNHRGFRIRTGGRSQPDPDTSERWIPGEYLDSVRNVLRDHFPDLAEQPLVESRACHYESSQSGEWIIDRHPEWENVWFAGAGNAEGFKFGPLYGDYIAARILGDDPFPELADRFRIPELDDTADSEDD